MPQVRFDGWLLPPHLAELFVPILRGYFERSTKVDKVSWPALVWDELDAGERVAALSASKRASGQKPDGRTDEKPDVAIIDGVNKRQIRGLRKAAAIAGVPVSTLADRVARGEIPAERHGHVYVFRVEHLKPQEST